MTTTRRQHYVWRGYLRSWASNDLIYCLRAGKIFRSNLMGVAQERDFYKLHDLTPEEVKYLENFCSVQPEPLRTINLRWVRVFTLLFDRQRDLIEKGYSPDQINKAIDRLAIIEEEKYHMEIENGAVGHLQSLLRGDASFFQNGQMMVKFLQYVCIQYTRTKNLKARALERSSQFAGVNPENVWNVLSHIVATSLTRSLVAESYQLHFLRPEGGAVFITGDQPVINVRNTATDPDDVPNELDLYYPISPKLALLIATEPPDDTWLTDEKVGAYNWHMQRHSHTQLYAHEAHVLEPFRQDNAAVKT
jgi:hypothetical protein